MSADVFTLPNYAEPALYSRSNLAPITRSVKFALADLTGAAGSAADPLETSDVIKIFKLPPDVKLMGAQLHTNDLDSGTTLTLDLSVTNGTTTKYFFKDHVVGQAGGAANTNYVSGATVYDAFDADSAVGWVVDNDNYYLKLLASAGATGAGSGDDIFVSVEYTSALESNEAAFRT
jgi:hypothetical protein